jgi:hypothetical protein
MLNAEDSKKNLVSQAKSGLSIAVVSVLIIALSFTLADSNQCQAGLCVGMVLLGFGIIIFTLANRKLNKICRK